MTRTTDTTLRISAKNLASKDIRDVSKDIDALADSQKKNASAADLAARSLKELRDEQRGLAAVGKELERRGSLIGNLQQQKAALDALRVKIQGTKTELERLQSVKDRGGFGTANIDKQITRVEKGIRSLTNEAKRTETAFNRTSDAAAKVGITLKNSGSAAQQIAAETARVAEMQRAATRAVEEYHTAVVASREALQAQEQAQKEITAEAQRRNAVEAAAAAQRRAEAAQRKAELEEQLRIRAELTKRFLAPQAAPAADTRATLGPGTLDGQALARQMQMRERLVNVLRRQKDGGEKLIAVDGKLAAASRNVAQALNGEAASMDRTHKMGGLLADTGRKSLSVYQRLRGQILSLAASYVGLYQAANLVKSAVSVDQERRKINIQLQTANGGDVQAAARDAKFLREEADRLGLVFEDVAKNFANYKIAAKAVGASNATIKKSFSEASEVVTGLGLSGEDAEGVFRAFVQILGKARVQAEELRGQLGDRLPGAVATFAKTLVETGKIKTFADLDGYLKKGKANVKDFLDFLHAYAQQTKGAVEQNSQSLFAQFNRLTNAWRDFLQQFSQAGVSKGLLSIVDQLTAKLKGPEGAKFARDLADAFSLVGRILVKVIEHFDTFVTLAKYYLGLQLTKGFLNLGIELLQTVVSYYKAGKAVYDYGKAVVIARNAGTAMTLGMRAMSALMGPLGIALGILAVGFYKVEKAEAAAARRADEFVDRMRAARVAQGEGILAELNDQQQRAKDTLRQLKEVGAQLEAAKKRRDDAFLGGLGDKLDYVADGLREEGVSVEALTERYNELKAQHEGYVSSVINGSKRYLQYKKQEQAALAAEAAQQDNFVTPTGDGGDTATDKAAAAAEARKQRIIDIQARAHQELLKMQEDFDQATVDKAVGTQEQIKANLEAQLSAISNSIARRKTELENLLNDAKRLGAGKAVGDINSAIGMLPDLQKELEAKARVKAATDSIALGEKKINELIAQRDAEIDIINTKVQVGLLTEAEGREKINGKVNEYKDRVLDAINSFMAALEALKASDPSLAAALHVDETIAKMEALRVKSTQVVTTTQLIAKNIGGQLANGVSSFFATFAKGVAGGIEGVHGIGDAFKYAINSFKSFLADFLVGMGQAILQAILLEAIMAAIEHRPANYGAAAKTALLGAGTGHTGGLVGSRTIGSGNEFRQVSSAIFAGARRFHDGGLPGLRANEVPAILKKGEEVLTRDDPRNVLNGGAAGGQAAAPVLDVSIHNNIDSGAVVESGIASKPGQRAIYNYISANRNQLRQLLQN